MSSHRTRDEPTADAEILAPLDQRARERLLQAIVEAEPECVKLLDANGTLRLMNPAGLRMIEAESLGQVAGQCAYPLVADEHRAAFRGLVEGAFRGDSGTLAFRIVGLKGTPRWLETHVVPFRGEDGAVVAALGITRDITDETLANVALRESAQNYRMLFEQAIDAIFVCADDLRFLDVNPAACEMTGYSREELLGLDVMILLDADDQARVPETLARLEAGDAPTGEWRSRRKDGTPYVAEARLKRLPDGRYQAFVRDITDRRRVEAQLLQAQKMESVGRLAGGVAHDFNNLLTVINGTAELVIAGLHGGSPLHADLEQIREAGERAAAMTRQLMALGRQQILQPEILDLNAILRGMRGMLEHLVGTDVALQLVLADSIGPIKADPTQMEQVIRNLATNARDAMPDGGTLTIETSNVAARSPAHRPLPPAPCIMLTVRDTGVGMDDAARRRAFEPFFTTKDVGKGVGLGLSTVYGIVKQSGGTVWLDSEPGRGSTFTISLPRADAAAPPRAAADADGSETILVVEDEAAVRGLTRRVLEAAGYRVLEAENAPQALQLVDRFADPIDLLLTDVVMPGMNGRELASRVARVRPDIKVLYTTGYTEDSLLRRGVLDATHRVVTKPFTSRDLRRKVRETLDT